MIKCRGTIKAMLLNHYKVARHCLKEQTSYTALNFWNMKRECYTLMPSCLLVNMKEAGAI